MKVSLIKSFLLFILFVISSHAQWVQTNGPYGGTLVRPITGNGNNLYVGTTGGMYVSSNSGSDWIKINNGFTGEYPMEITFNNNNLYAATWGDGIFKSTNQGQSWFHINSPFPDIYSINSVGNNLFAGTHGLYRSTDGGNTWNLLLYINPPSFDVFALAVSGNTLYVGSKGIRKSTDNGVSWSQIFQDSTHGFRFLIVSGNNIYAAPLSVSEYGVWVSTNSGVNWSLENNGLPGYTGQPATAMAYDGSKLYVASYFSLPSSGYLYYSPNNGVNFYPMGTGLPNKRIFSLGTQGSTLFAGTDNAGVYSTSNLGSTWSIKNNGITSEVTCIAVSGNLLFAGTHFGLYLSTDLGNSWNSTTLTNQQNVSAVAIHNGRIFASADSGVYISTNNGLNWKPSSLRRSITSFYADGNNLFAVGSFAGVNLTTDNGGTWALLNNGILYPNTSTLVRKGNKLFCGTWDGNPNHNYLYVSTNYGSSWSVTSLTHLTTYSLLVQGNSIFAGTHTGVYISTDDGSTWFRSISQSPKSARSLAGTANVLFVSADNYYSVLDTGVYYSTDGGLNWNQYNDGLINYHIPALALSNNILYAATLGESVWKRDVSSLVGIISQNQIPKEFKLYQNFPNPFNPGTKISYDLALSGYVKLIIYDVMGREVKALVNEKENAGSYEVEFDGSNLPSGVYYYKLISGDFVETRKMVLVK